MAARKKTVPQGNSEEGDRLRRLRNAFDWTQDDVASRSGETNLSRVDVSNTERGANKLTSVNIREGLRLAYGLSRDDLAGYIGGEIPLADIVSRCKPPPAKEGLVTMDGPLPIAEDVKDDVSVLMDARRKPHGEPYFSKEIVVAYKSLTRFEGDPGNAGHVADAIQGIIDGASRLRAEPKGAQKSGTRVIPSSRPPKKAGQQ